jgi:hypothetical protein
MANLTTAQKQAARGDFATSISVRRDSIAVSKPDLDAAITAVDNWIESNSASFNSALPLPARTALTARQKLELFYFVARKRFEVG